MKDLINFLSKIGLHYSESELTNLQTLDLSSNSLATLPESMGKLSKLQLLYLTGNLIAALPESICKLPNLRIYK